ncbi:hypothetical protein [Mycobacterium sp. AZCC_0083]|uniref:hypothetical protein n=1 Tax=Mycobacterium sp. AZCC_0083 TaxID=2735882 RepID=UPI001607625B|nr:hypothetical protein [Mycobacterium sp. AZCC_0083]MBB5168516.1 hypothetical protein [Mycobacterium sp. AZCC_0083]
MTLNMDPQILADFGPVGQGPPLRVGDVESRRKMLGEAFGAYPASPDDEGVWTVSS